MKVDRIVDVKRELRFHTMLWAGYFLFEVFAYVNYDYTFKELTILFFLGLPGKVLFIYPTLFWTVPKFFFTKKYLTFGLVSLSILLICMILHRSSVYYGFIQNFRPEIFNSTPLWDPKALFRSFEFTLTISSMFIAFSLMRLSYKQQEMNSQLVTANMRAELMNLKEQIKPHFLFNTLNNLYGLTTRDPEKASEVVLRLSQLMNYVLYSSNDQKVSILKEAMYLDDYLEVERIRYGKHVQIIFHKQIENEEFEIPPLLLQPFVENAFKHGMSRQVKDPWLKIDLVVKEKSLNFTVSNSKPPALNGVHPTTSGIGLDNVRKRLELIYPGNHRLKIIDEQDAFLVSLSIGKKLANGSVSAFAHEDQVPVN